MQKLVTFIFIELIFKSFNHLFFWSRIYCLTTSKETLPTVEMNLLRVHKQGILLRKEGNSARKQWAVKPFICAVTFMTPTRGSISRSKCTWSGITSISKTTYPYCSCFSMISCFNRVSMPSTKTFLRYLGQKIKWYWQLNTIQCPDVYFLLLFIIFIPSNIPYLVECQGVNFR